MRIPVWNWFESSYKIRASKTATTIAMLELDEAREKVELQVNQSSFKVSEANKRLNMANKNTERRKPAMCQPRLQRGRNGRYGCHDRTDGMAAGTLTEDRR